MGQSFVKTRVSWSCAMRIQDFSNGGNVLLISSFFKIYSLQFIYLYSALIKADYVISKVFNRKIINIKD